MPPFIEIDGKVYAVIGWEPDMPYKERYELRLLTADEEQRFRQIKRELEIELWANMNGD